MTTPKERAAKAIDDLGIHDFVMPIESAEAAHGRMNEWAPMSNRCESCRYWDTSCQPSGMGKDTHGLCRRLPPIADDRDGMGRWPFTEDCDWCGQYERDAEKDTRE